MHLLRAGARRGDEPDRPRPDHVGEAQPDPADDRGAAVGAHDEQPALAAACLSATSCSTGTLSENTITDAPASSASIASTNA